MQPNEIQVLVDTSKKVVGVKTINNKKYAPLLQKIKRHSSCIETRLAMLFATLKRRQLRRNDGRGR